MDLYPAIDIRDGGAVRLTQGDFDRQSDYGDPVALARRFAAGGAPWLHVVDLDAARLGPAGQPGHGAGHRRAPSTSRSQTGGGVRTEDDVAELLDGGVARVVLGTAALDDPGLVRTLATAAIPAGWPSASTTGATPTVGPRWPSGAGSRARAARSASCSTRWPAPAWPR